MRTTLTRAFLLSGAFALALLGGRALTQPKNPSGVHTINYPTGDASSGLLALELSAPPEVRLGEPYKYQVKVTNLSKTMTLHNVRVRQTSPAGLQVSQSEPPAQASQPPSAPQQPQPKGDQPAAAQAGATSTWALGALAPGQSQVVAVTAVAHEAGDRSVCLTASYEPALCVALKVGKPALEVTKEIPTGVDICDPIPVKYVVKNSGDAAAPGVVVREDFQKDLSTHDGKQAAAFEAGDLAPGQSKEFTAKLVAANPGVYSGQAVAASGKQTSQSRQTSTTVTAAALNVTVQGQDTSTVGTPTGYTVTVANTGGAVARGTRLRVGVAGDRVAIVHATPEGREKDALNWDLGDIKPNESRKLAFSVNTGPGQIKVSATAESACAGGNNKAATASAAHAATAIALPGLLLTFVDTVDPVKVGAETDYVIVVVNQGHADDQNVVVAVTFPPELQPQKAGGTTEGKIEGNIVRFTPIPTMRPGARAEWRINVKALKAGDLRPKCELDSKHLKGNPGVSIEPTTVVP